jgi:hypothetical protein
MGCACANYAEQVRFIAASSNNNECASNLPPKTANFEKMLEAEARTKRYYEQKAYVDQKEAERAALAARKLDVESIASTEATLTNESGRE